MVNNGIDGVLTIRQMIIIIYLVVWNHMLDYHYGILLSMIITIMMSDDITIMIWFFGLEPWTFMIFPLIYWECHHPN